MTTKNEGLHAGGFIVSEANGARSREQIVVVAGQTLSAGAVLGIVNASGKYAAYDNGAADGTQAAVGILLEAVDAAAADQPGVALVRDAEVNAAELDYSAGSSGGADITAAIADLLALGIIAR